MGNDIYNGYDNFAHALKYVFNKERVSMDDREQYLLNEIVKLRKENAELREQIERYENEGRSFNPEEIG
ncbi:hypothetical protein [Staphylococcus phage SpP]